MKNPHAVALGRLGGLKGGPARARKLSRVQRQAVGLTGALTKRKEHHTLTLTTGGAVIKVDSGLLIYADPEYYTEIDDAEGTER